MNASPLYIRARKPLTRVKTFTCVHSFTCPPKLQKRCTAKTCECSPCDCEACFVRRTLAAFVTTVART